MSRFQFACFVAIALAVAALANAGEAPQHAKLAVPDAAAQARAGGAVHEVFNNEIAATRTNAERAAIALKMLQAGSQTLDDPAGCYVLLSSARDLAADSGDSQAAFRAISAIDERFTVDAGTMRVESASRLAKALVTSTDHVLLANRLLGLIDNAVRADSYAEAKQLAAIALASARRAADLPLIAQVSARINDLAAIEDAFNQAAHARVVLAAQPTDSAANAAVGRFSCFYKGDWDAGLPFLTRGNDADAKAIALRDLVGASTADAQIVIGDGWWELGQKFPGVMQRQLQLRAARWYRSAMPMSRGLTAEKIKLRTTQALAAAGVADVAPISPPAAVAVSPPNPRLAPAPQATNDRTFADLTAAMNRMNGWTPKSGNWEMTADHKLRGEGDSEIVFNDELPGQCSIAFHMKVVKGMRPRVHFDGTEIYLGNEGYSQTIWIHGKPRDVTGEAFPYKSNEEMQVRIIFIGDRFKLQINDHVIEGKARPADQIKLRFSGGDWWSKGTTEFWGFVASPVPATMNPSAPTTPAPRVAPPVAVAAPAAVDEKVSLKLPGPLDNIVAGGGGRYLLLHVKDRREIAVFDATVSRIVKVIPLPSETLLYAAGADKLVIAMPDQGVIQRYSLSTYLQEATSALPQGEKLDGMAMGYASSGPLMLMRRSGPQFIDLASLRPLPVRQNATQLRSWRPHPDYPLAVRVSADNSTFAAWEPKISPSGIRELIINGPYAVDHYVHESAGVLLPDHDGQLLFTGNGIYSRDLKPIDPETFAGMTCIPAYQPGFFIGVRFGDSPAKLMGGPTSFGVYATSDRRLIFQIRGLDELHKVISSARPFARGLDSLGIESRIYLMPAANLLITVPDSLDELILRRFNLPEQMNKAGVNYLFVTSVPPPSVARTAKYVYDIEVKSKQGGVTFALNTGPKGMKISPNGHLEWKAPAFISESQIAVIVSIKDASGQEIFQTFNIAAGVPTLR